ncbi:cephalosporin-C deacetylase [Nocardioides terrae]|uniref:Cephalosporin-C deacetylase n=1 Tax=Nocardioides terrae TaxID=574651 RepID=A0A1I1P2C6_9ACTN|nr:acetylxylan esterase [Nocardioides terrae]SFD03989.1 cephalosporin-C deacetylase [Nocardioides terrae]
MPRIDLTLPELWDYRPELPEPSGFDAFWSRTLSEQAGYPLAVTLEPVDNGLVAVETFDLTFAGFGGDPVRAWLHLPAAALRDTERLPGVVQFQGYNGGRGLPHEHVFWALAGYAHLVMDTRGQGSGWTTGATGDPHGSGPSTPGFLTRGIGHPDAHFYRRVFVDAVRAVEVLRGHDLVDPDRVAVTGISQGGGIALAAGALADGVAAVMPDVPFLCDFRRAADLPTLDPYAEIGRYLAAHRDEVDLVFDTLAHFDGALMARRATAPALFSVAVADTICPPSTVFAAHHSYRAAKEIAVYEFNDHEGGGPFQQARQAAWLAEVLA